MNPDGLWPFQERNLTVGLPQRQNVTIPGFDLFLALSYAMRVFGLFGSHIEHSRSPAIWAEIFRKRGISNAVYVLFQVRTVWEILSIIRDTTELEGFNLTMPFKESLIPHLSHEEEVVRKTRSCNTIKIERQGNDFKLSGTNTDPSGFRESLKDFDLKPFEKALILGTGGAARSVAFALEEMKLTTQLVSRRKQSGFLCYSYITPGDLKTFRMLVNATPLGGPGFETQVPPLPYPEFHANQIAIDLLYHQPITPFLEKIKPSGAFLMNGLPMLKAQAEHAACFLLDNRNNQWQ